MIFEAVYDIHHATVQMVFIHKHTQRKYAAFVNNPLWDHIPLRKL